MVVRLQRARYFLAIPAVITLLLALLCIVVLVLLQRASVFQGLELRALDYFLLNRPSMTIDDRIVVIGETEVDIRRYGHPLSDKVLADAVQVLENAGARVIGIDKYRDVAVAPGTQELTGLLQRYNNVVWIFFAGHSAQDFIPPPTTLINNPERMGFNDVIEDRDGVLRRGLLFLDVDNVSYFSFPLLLAIHYLAVDQISPQSDAFGYLSLNGISLPPIGRNFGAYQQMDAGGYQIMLAYPGLPQSFRFFRLEQLLTGQIDTELLRGKIVLIGSAAPSLADYKLFPNEIRRFGVEYHAFFTSQLLNIASLDQRPLQAWSGWVEFCWLSFWCLVGAFTGLRKDNLLALSCWVLIGISTLLIVNYLLLTYGWWLPLVAPMTGWAAAFAISTLYFFRQEQNERRQLMQIFSRHVSPEVATRLWTVRDQFFSDGGVKPDTLTATVLFTDITNFTAIAESMDPLALMGWLNQYMEEMSRIVIAHGGMINKYMGDAIMAVFGVPVKRESDKEITDDARQSIRCASAFNQRLLQLNQQWQLQGLPAITMRVGIHTGSVVAGSLGSLQRMEYTVIGDSVNIASRLESFDKAIAPPDEKQPCRILIAETTYSHVADLCKVHQVGQCQLKGRKKPLLVFQVLP